MPMPNAPQAPNATQAVPEPAYAKPLSGRALLGGVIMRADRSRFLGAALTVLVLQLPATLARPAREALLGLAGLLVVLIVQRAAWVRQVPALPKPGGLNLHAIVSSAWLRRTAAVAGFGLAALFASLAHHGELLRRCDPAAACAAASSPFGAAWAAFFGLYVAAEYAGAAQMAGHIGVTSPWPAVRPAPYHLMRAALVPSAARALRASAHVMTAMLLLWGLARPAVLALGGTASRYAGTCAACAAGPDGGAAATLPSLSALAALFARGACFHACVWLAAYAVPVMYTQPLDFDAAAALVPAPAGAPVGLTLHLALETALSSGAPPLTQHLAYADLADLAETCPPRRRRAYEAERGAAWPRMLSALLRPLDQLSVALDATRKQRSDEAARAAKAKAVRLRTGRLAALLRSLRLEVHERAVRSQLFAASALVVFAARASACLLVGSTTEDPVGTVYLAKSLVATLNSMLRLLAAMEAFDPKKNPLAMQLAAAPAPAPAAPGGGGGGGGGGAAEAGLRVRLSAPARARAVGAQRAAAIEAELHRAIYLLLKTYGTEAVLASGVKPELLPRLQGFATGLA
jgi:hypothetical protein